jgi:Peptidase inhibitor I78 family
MRLLILLLTAATLLQACEMTDGTQPGPPRGGLVSCHAVGLDGLVGRSVSLLPRHGEWSSLRVIYPGQAVTMDYVATRLNARVGPKGTILSLYCG